MTLYREQLKRLAKFGAVLLALVVIVSTVMTVQNCQTEVERDLSLTSAYCFDQVLLAFMYIGGVGFAFIGFSFLVRRADSDFYHSLPVKRSDLYLSVTMAALTWIVGTVFLSILFATAANLITGRSFVPMYPLMNFVYYIAGTMLVFAAAAIALSVTGTWFSAGIVTSLVLFLPRYILFIAARGVAAQTNGLTNWVDFGVLLNPAYNAATAPIVLLFRPALQYNLMRLGTSAYSLAVAVIELIIGGVLFTKRKSEIAEHGATSGLVQTVFACLAALPLLLLAISGRVSGSGVVAFQGVNAGVLIVLVLSLGLYIIYQMVVLKNFKSMLCSLPWFFATLLVSVGILAASKAYGVNMERFAPSPDEIESVEFLIAERNEYETNTYRSLLVSEIPFTDEATIAYVARNLSETRATVNDGYYYYYDPYTITSREAVRFNMKDGTSAVRNVRFANRATLESLRRRNAAYVEALGMFAPTDSICGRTENIGAQLTDADIEEIRVSYEKEFPKSSIEPGAEVFPLVVLPNEIVGLTDQSAQYGIVQTYGYVGSERYIDSYLIVPAMEKTCSLWMQRCNDRANADKYADVMQLMTDSLSDTAPEWNSFTLNIDAYNVPIEGRPYFHEPDMYITANGGRCMFTPEAQAIVIETAKLLSRGTPTCDPKAVTLRARYWSQTERNTYTNDYVPQYLTYDAAACTRITELFNAWHELQKTPDLMYVQN